MATATELLRAAEHMRKLSSVQRDTGLPSMADASHRAADALEREAKRLQAIEAQQPRRSWPEGWPPFAVLRRAHRLLNVTPTPSTRWLENNGHKHDLDRARSIRADWDEALAAEVYGELPPEEVAR